MVHHTAYGVPIESLDVVVIDDSRFMCTILRSMLAALGVFRQRAFDCAPDAVESMLLEPPNVIISDWRMSPVSGYVMAKQIRQRMMAPLCYVPIIMVTAHGTRVLVEKALEAGVHYVLVKPLAFKTLCDRLHQITHDDRQFILNGDVYKIEGMENKSRDQDSKYFFLDEDLPEQSSRLLYDQDKFT